MFCQKCGKEIKDNAKFCNYCGAEQSTKENGMSTEKIQVDETGNTEKILSSESVATVKPKKNKKLLAIIVAVVAIIFICCLFSCNSSKKKNSTDHEQQNENIENNNANNYQKSNSYNISCNGNNDIAIEAANVFANKYGASGHDWVLKSVDASATGMSGTLRYTYSWAGNTYTATRSFSVTDYGSYRNYQWQGDFAELFYGN